MTSTATDQCIVLPFRPENREAFTGNGLALHFLIGNVLVLHTGLKEMWFGWRVKKIFARQEAFQRYCRSVDEQLNLVDVSRTQKVRFWISGSYSEQTATLELFDADAVHTESSAVTLEITTDDNLVTFRARFMDWLAAAGHPLPGNQIQAALWPEAIDSAGLDAVGRALEDFYVYSAYGGDGLLDTQPFEKAVIAAPKSFMAQDLYGWALYRNKQYAKAKAAFLTSVGINPAGAGAMSGLMWCGVYGQDLEEAMFWSGRKADVCRKDIEAAREAGRRRYQKVNG